MHFFAPAVFAGAFLLFQVQPLMAKFVLPWFGGSSGVWTVCVLFFQAILVAGYAYAHLTTRLLRPRVQAVLHVALLVTALLTLPIVPGAAWKPAPTEDPTAGILLLLAACLGLPYFALSATGPLLQAWFVQVRPGVVPYRLYALSNAGSLLALVSYPFLFEPLLTRRAQADVWAWGFGAFVLVCTLCAWQVWRAGANRVADDNAGGNHKPKAAAAGTGAPGFDKLLWFGLPACASVLLLASTNKLCEDVASFPFLWILPLSLYLLTFVICFDHSRWYARKTFTLLLVPVLALLCYALFQESDLPLLAQAAVYSGTVFVGCMVCHGEVYRRRPAPESLTLFYLLIAAGGAAGGAFVALAAPHLFRTYAELKWGVGLLVSFVVAIHIREKSAWAWQGRLRRVWPALAVAAVVLGVVFFLQTRFEAQGAVLSTRNFYGALQIRFLNNEVAIYHAYRLRHGQINHGLQFLDPSKAMMPTSYFGDLSGIGVTMNQFPRQANRRVGVVGLGVGTVAAYGRPGDTFRFYEINPEVERLARSRFSYLGKSQAGIQVVLGDARISLENEAPQQFDVLILDAFSSDAIPAHLLTEEAFALYLRHLKPDGVIAVHISSRHLDLYPVVLGAAERFQLSTAFVYEPQAATLWWFSASEWVLVTRNRAFLDAPAVRAANNPPTGKPARPLLWTDDHTSLFEVMR